MLKMQIWVLLLLMVFKVMILDEVGQGVGIGRGEVQIMGMFWGIVNILRLGRWGEVSKVNEKESLRVRRRIK